jgi:cysteine-rich repeat protein
MEKLKLSGVVALLLVACGGDGTETGDPSTSTSTPDPTTGQLTSTSVPTTGDVDPTTGVVDPTTGDVDPTTGDGTSTTTPDTDTEDTIDPSAATTGDVPVCGDGMVGGGEACDDGNKENTDACLDTCVPAACGDGFTQDGVEACDDANGDNTDACLDTCVAASCGDAFVQADVEACDDGNDVETDGCLNTCAVASCGDGVTWDGVEACDDGNDVDDDACSNMCASASCGDGVVQAAAGEECDDKNMVDTDACLNTCKLPTCGDGVVWANMEDCDEGGANNDETGPCRTDCTLCECQGEDVMGQTCGDFGFSCGGLSCDGCNIDTAECASPSLPNFNGQPGPTFVDSCWQQCEGYLDVLGGDDVPAQWGNDCAGAEFSRLRIVCGSSVDQYRYLTVEKNVFKDGLIAYPENGLISEAKNQAGVDFPIDNVIYASGNHPHNGSSWWNGPQGCGESNNNVTINNICEREVSNCFGQNIAGDRFLWVYVAP